MNEVCKSCGHTHTDGLKRVEVCVALRFCNGGVFYCGCEALK